MQQKKKQEKRLRGSTTPANQHSRLVCDAFDFSQTHKYKNTTKKIQKYKNKKKEKQQKKGYEAPQLQPINIHSWYVADAFDSF